MINSHRIFDWEALEDMRVDRNIILKCILEKKGCDLDGSHQAQDKRPVAGFCKHGNEVPVSIKKRGIYRKNERLHRLQISRSKLTNSVNLKNINYLKIFA
jgi:hypothetical protein